jgi:RNA polymerase sigma factor (sigma-70 family)
MDSPSDGVEPSAKVPGLFATTHWSVVLTAGRHALPQAIEALEKLCRTYWYPLYTYVRRRGHDAQDAQDLTQEFFCRLLQRNYLAQADPHKGKFRSFLLVAVNHLLANEWDRAKTIKRGGQVTFLSLDDAAEQRYLEEPATDLSPERIYEQSWAVALLGKVLARLREECAASGKANQFDDLKRFLTGEKPSVSYAKLAATLDTTEAALKMAVQRLRRRYGELLREEIAHTVADPEQVEDELRHLCEVLSW